MKITATFLYAFVIAFTTFSSAQASLTAQAIERSKRAWEYLKSVPHEYTDRYVNGRVVIRGLPNRETNVQIRVMTSNEISNTVFRHYTPLSKVHAIQESGYLIAGPVAYVNSPYIYTDMTGVFLTLPNCKPEKVGLDSSVHSGAIDFQIHSQITVIRIEPCIFLVPGPAALPDWMKVKVQNAKQTNDPYYGEYLKRNQVGYDALVVPFVKKFL